MSTSKLTRGQKDAIQRAIYLLKVAAHTDIVNESAEADYDETTCDGSCFRDDARDAADTLVDMFEKVFKIQLPSDTPNSFEVMFDV